MVRNSVQLTRVGLLCLSIAFTAQVAGADADREKYTPYPEDGFPQIIQRNDYPTIRCIETLFQALSPLGTKTDGGFKATLLCEATSDALTFRSEQNPKKNLSVRVAADEAVLFSGKKFTTPATVIFFKTMLRVVGDLAKPGEASKVGIRQFGARTYKKRTVIGFDFQARVVEIECNSNGPRDPERLYILDIVDRGESYLWSH